IAKALGDLIDAELALGNHIEVLPRLEALVEEDPLRERRWAQLMLALYRCGRQADALRAYKKAAEVLGEELGIGPGPDLYSLEERILLHDPSLTLETGAEELLTNLERPPTALVGRVPELVRLVELTRSRRLITLTGPGGVGKTRLAVEAGCRALSSFPDGVWFVDLAPILDPAQLNKAVAEGLGVAVRSDATTLDQVRAHCSHRSLLLILDNCEHLLEPAARLVQTLLVSGSPLRVLATSRERLGIDGETTWTVPPLTFPANADADFARGNHEAVDLFVDRAEHVNPSFDLTADNAAPIARICRKLDGLPLAIELAAAWVDVLSVAEIEKRLNDPLESLEHRARFQPIRHATLWEAMRWSYDLLDEDERDLLQRLSVFVGRFLLEDAEIVCSSEKAPRERVFGLLTRLVEKSLVVPHVSEDAPTRYSLLETVRSFAASIAETAGVAGETSHRHAERFLALALEAKEELQGPQQRWWLDRMELDLGNIRTALAWLADIDALEDALRFAAALLWFWKMHDHTKEGAALLIAMLARREPVAPEVRAEALIAAAVLESTGDIDAAYDMLAEATDVAAEAGDDSAESMALGWMGLFDRIRGDLEASQQHLDMALRRAERAGDDRPVSLVLGHLAVLARELGSYAEAISHHRRAIEIDRQLSNRQGEAWNTAGIGIVHLYEGAFEEARDALVHSEAVHNKLGFGFELVTVWILLAISAAKLGDPDAAAIHLARAQQRAVTLDSPRLLDAV
ncbi:MAG TPA: tetratricopeptide repeat protein, partial [Acidimicrobiia bacterium]|nr:tetratricopeptide repeat protein [Acidimicrobiia bacterium]